MDYFSSSGSALKKIGCLATASAVLAWSGCSSGVAPSKTASNAGTGAVIGGLGGAVIGSNSSLGTGMGAAAGAGAGALIGGIVGLVQEAKDRKEQDRLAQERGYQQELAKKRSEEARRKAEMDEELAVAQGFRISDIELNDAQKTLATKQAELKALEEERSAAKAKKLALDDAKEKTLQAEAKIAAMREELTRLKGDDPTQRNPAPPATGDKKLDANAPPSAAVKPGN